MSNQREHRESASPAVAVVGVSALFPGSSDVRGGEICACLGVSVSAVQAAIDGGATSLSAVGDATRAGTSCGSCRPEIRALLRAARPRQAA